MLGTGCPTHWCTISWAITSSALAPLRGVFQVVLRKEKFPHIAEIVRGTTAHHVGAGHHDIEWILLCIGQRPIMRRAVRYGVCQQTLNPQRGKLRLVGRTIPEIHRECCALEFDTDIVSREKGRAESVLPNARFGFLPPLPPLAPAFLSTPSATAPAK